MKRKLDILFKIILFYFMIYQKPNLAHLVNKRLESFPVSFSSK